jgi:hypothetical protein
LKLNKHKLKEILIYAAFIFLLAFPKGGIKIEGFPITWGYLLLSILAFTSILSIYRKHISKNQVILTGLIPFQAIIAFSFIFIGIDNYALAIATLVNFVYLPVVYNVLIFDDIKKFQNKIILPILRHSISFVCIFGIFLFIYQHVYGDLFTIPYITINVDDIDTMLDKFNNRGTFYKLISTYNNGNIFGVSILMLMPLYIELSKRRNLARIILNIALILTFSRTVWLGLIFYDLISMNKKLFNITNIFMTVVFIFLAITIFDWNILDVFDSSLGGRSEQFMSVRSINFLPEYKFSPISESVYLQTVSDFGILGLIFYLIAMTSPILIYKFNKKYIINGNNIPLSCCRGLIIFLFVSISDGAIFLIPIMSIYWLLSTLILVNIHSEFTQDQIYDYIKNDNKKVISI